MRIEKKTAAGLMLAILLSPSLFAAEKPEAQYREKVMEAVGGHMGAMATILKKRVHMDELDFHAQAIANLATIVPGTFPEGSGGGKSEAKAEIWSKPEDFKQAMDKFVDAAKGMAAATTAMKGGDASGIGPGIKALGGSCKGCHDDFKEE